MAKITTQSFKDAMQLISPAIDITGEYVSSKTKIACKCKKCNHEFAARPQDLKRKKAKCTKCSGKYHRPTDEEFKSMLKAINSHITPLTRYAGANKIISCECNICELKWNSTPSRLLNSKCGCPRCAGSYQPKHSEFVSQLNSVSPSIEVLSEYINSSSMIECNCRICKHEWTAEARNLIQHKTRCPICSVARRNISESELFELIKCMFPDSIREYQLGNFGEPAKFHGVSRQKYDLYIPSYNVAIEYMGRQHYEASGYFGGDSEFELIKERDARKLNFSLASNITQVDVRYTTFSKRLSSSAKDKVVKLIEQAIQSSKMPQHIVI